MKSLLVFGGNGFLGKRICQTAIEHGFKVTSLTRSGKPPRPMISSEKDWISEVNWRQCDVFDVNGYNEYLQDATNVVHSIGILLEDSSYKQKLKSNEPFKMSSPQWGNNPLKKDSKFTYEMMNKQSALKIAEELAKIPVAAEKRTFTYISADRGFPLVYSGYITSKREAEMGLMRLEEKLRPIIMRPGFMFDEVVAASKGGKDLRTAFKTVFDTFNFANRLILRNKLGFVNELIRPTVSTQQVSRAVIAKIEDPTFSGVCPLDEILDV
ncbi:LAMI_0G06326g1_1 [Lachancea mirantina]|uniref:LAMI_0G06326g1_1 n=1 Tax=Lachancea mirantina TaxID=1230905 RepID=A0A1G4K968_9SACH|nr:LAMI_0G06326g1_1 [Lachancea mirantina]